MKEKTIGKDGPLERSWAALVALFAAVLLGLALCAPGAAWGEGEVAQTEEVQAAQASDASTLEAALAIENNRVELTQNIDITSQLDIASGVTLIGNGKTIRANNSDWDDSGAEKYMLLANGVDIAINDVVIDGNDQAHGGLHFYNATDGSISDVTVRNVKQLGININGSSVTATGTIELDNCLSWGHESIQNYINVSYGTPETSGDLTFDCSEATLDMSGMYTDSGDLANAANKQAELVVSLPAEWYSYIDASTGSKCYTPKASAAAKIGEVYFPNLASAIVCADADSTITVLKDIEGGVKIPSGKNIVIDLKGHVFDVKQGVGSTGTETNGIQLIKGSTVTIKSGTLTSSVDNLGFMVKNYANLTLEDVIIKADKLRSGSSTVNNCGQLTIRNCEIKAVNESTWAVTTGNYRKDDVIVTTIESGVIDSAAIETPLWAIGGATVNESVTMNIAGGTIGKVGEWDWRPSYAGYENAPALANPKIAITGGTFSTEPDAEYIAEGYVVKGGAPTFKVVAKNAYIKAELTTDIGEKTFTAGSDEWVEFTFSTVANDDAGMQVYGGSDFGVLYEDKIAALEYKYGDQWFDMKGQNFGGSQGFPMADATSTFRVKFTDDAAGNYTFVASMWKVGDTGEENALCSVDVPFTVEAPYVAPPYVPSTPSTPAEPEPSVPVPDASGETVEESTTTTEDGTTVTTEVKADGTVVETVKGSDGSVATSASKSETVENADGTETTVTATNSEVVTADGDKVTAESVTRVTENADGRHAFLLRVHRHINRRGQRDSQCFSCRLGGEP